MDRKQQGKYSRRYGRSRRRKGSALSYAVKRILLITCLIALAAALALVIRYMAGDKYNTAKDSIYSSGSVSPEDSAFPENSVSAESMTSVGAIQAQAGGIQANAGQTGESRTGGSQANAGQAEESRTGESQAEDRDSSPALNDDHEKSTAKLLFAGDIYLSSHVLSAHDSAGGISGILSPDLISLIDEADIFMANLEFPFSSRGTPEEDKSFTFRVAPDRAGLLNEIGVDIVSLANNHTLDFGTEALMDTISTLDGIGVAHTGAGADSASANEAVIKEIGGKRFAFLGASRVLPYADWTAGKSSPGINSIYDPYKSRIFDRLSELSKTTDYQIVYVHWGTEEKDTPDDYMRNLAKELVSAGADLVIGSHPHVLQGIEYIDGVPIVYSLGNFLFGSVIESTMLLSIDWDLESGVPELSVHPAKGASGYTESIPEGPELEKFNTYYGGLCRQLEK